MSRRREANSVPNPMRATAQSLSLASGVLGFEIIELWIADAAGQLKCSYAYVDEAVLTKHPELISGHHSNHRVEHRLSPKLCELANKADKGWYWRIVEDTSLVTASADLNTLNELYTRHSLPFKSEMTYLVEGITDDSTKVYIVGLSLERKSWAEQKLKFLQGIAYAIYVAALELDEDISWRNKLS